MTIDHIDYVYVVYMIYGMTKDLLVFYCVYYFYLLVYYCVF